MMYGRVLRHLVNGNGDPECYPPQELYNTPQMVVHMLELMTLSHRDMVSNMLLPRSVCARCNTVVADPCYDM
jgi:hypothetical protein